MSVEEIKTCTVHEAREAVYLNPNYQLIDVREYAEYEAVRIVNSISVPLSSFEQSFQKINKNEPAYIMCGIGKRAKLAADFLQAHGYDKVFVVDGGIKAWMDAGLSVIGHKDKYTPGQ